MLNKSDHNVSFISLSNGKEIKMVEVGLHPHEVAISPDGQIAVVTNYGNRENAGSTLSVIDISKKQVINTIQLENGSRPHGIQFIDQQQVLVSTEGRSSVMRVNINTHEIEEIQTGQQVTHMIVHVPGEQLAFTANIGSGNVTVVDLKSGKKVTDITTGAGAEGIAYLKNQNEVWVTNRGNNTISVIDCKKLIVKETIETDEFPIRIKFTPTGKHALVSNANSATIQVIDTENYKPIKSIMVNAEEVENDGRLATTIGNGPIPVGILVHPSGKYAFVANTNADIITVLNLSDFTLAGRLNTRREPDGLAYIR